MLLGQVMKARALCVRAQQTLHISSTQNPAVKHCVKLRTSGSYRRQTGTVLLVGEDLVTEVATGGAAVTALMGLDGEQLPDIAAQRLVAVSESVMAKVAGVETVPRAMLAAEVAMPPQADLMSLRPGSLTRVLVLDGIQDPGNLGTLLRSALALGWQAAVLLPGCTDPFNDKALKASRGAAFRLPVAQYSVEQWEQLLEVQGLTALAADPDRPAAAGGSNSSNRNGADAAGQQSSRAQQQVAESDGSLADVQARLAKQRLCLCVGAEGQGVSAEVRQRCSSVSIPQAGQMESLNAAAAGAILMFALSEGACPLLGQLADLQDQN